MDWIEKISNTKNIINKNKFPQCGFLLIAIGIWIYVFFIVYISYTKKRYNRNKEE